MLLPFTGSTLNANLTNLTNLALASLKMDQAMLTWA